MQPLAVRSKFSAENSDYTNDASFAKVKLLGGSTVIGFLIDLDGTLYNGHNPIPEAFEFIDLLQQKKLPFLLLTNNSS